MGLEPMTALMILIALGGSSNCSFLFSLSFVVYEQGKMYPRHSKEGTDRDFRESEEQCAPSNGRFLHF